MATLEQYINNLDLPRPEDQEDSLTYARRLALIGGHTGVAWSMTHRPPAVIENVTEVPDLVLAHRLEGFIDALPIEAGGDDLREALSKVLTGD